jgi:hypothetical protein
MRFRLRVRVRGFSVVPLGRLGPPVIMRFREPKTHEI